MSEKERFILWEGKLIKDSSIDGVWVWADKDWKRWGGSAWREEGEVVSFKEANAFMSRSQAHWIKNNWLKLLYFLLGLGLVWLLNELGFQSLTGIVFVLVLGFGLYELYKNGLLQFWDELIFPILLIVGVVGLIGYFLWFSMQYYFFS